MVSAETEAETTSTVLRHEVLSQTQKQLD